MNRLTWSFSHPSCDGSLSPAEHGASRHAQLGRLCLRKSTDPENLAVMSWIDRQPIVLFLLIALTVGLAPFVPEPHLWEKLKMLAAGTLTRPLDIFDFLLHAIPWVLLGIKLYRVAAQRAQ